MYNQSYYEKTKFLDSITLLLHRSVQTKNLLAVKKIHGNLLRTGLLFPSFNIHKKLIFSYISCFDNDTNFKTLTGLLKFLNPRNPIPFNEIVSDSSRKGFAFSAVKTFSFMHSGGVPLDTYALCSTLTATTSTKDVIFGQQTHAHVVRSGWLSSVFVGSALVDLYAKAAFLDNAAKVFDEIPLKNTVCANALLSGYSEAKMWNEVLVLVRKMPFLGLFYDNFTLAAILRACSGLTAIELGRQIHANILRRNHKLEDDVFLLSSLIEIYGKCGLVNKAWQVFNLAGIGQGENKGDIVLWTSMLGVYGRNGYFEKVFELYSGMLIQGIKPDQVAFLTIISACAHTGQIELGIKHFKSMMGEYNFDPCPEHYSCLVDLFCRAGELDKAWNLINDMVGNNKGNGNSSISMWGSLLSACEECGNIELGRLAAQKALELEPHNAGIYMMLSNLFAKFGLWDDIHRLREEIKEKGLYKDIGQSWMEVSN